MHRSNGGLEKRGLDPADLEDGRPEPKRRAVPGLASVIIEALKVDSLQKLCSSIEPILRRVVSEEVERALAKLGPARDRVTGRSSPKRIEGADGRNLQLHFQSALSLPLFTGGKVEGEQGAAIHVILIDANTGLVVTTGPEASAKLDIVVLEGDFNNEDDEGWTEEEFENQIVKEREGKRPLLTGELQVTLKEGVGTLGELSFTDNSSWIRSRKFRLGLRVVPGFCEGVRIREAKTEAFAVKDHRGELYKKHYPPLLKDEVWRLEKIGKDGSFHKKLTEAGIYTVEDFLRLFVKDSSKLRSILGSNMSNKMWDSLSEHAKTCVLSGKLYVYYPDNTRSVGAVFNDIYEFNGLIAGEQYCPAETLQDNQKVFVDTLIKKAYDNWNDVIEFDGKALLHPRDMENKTSSIYASEMVVNSVNYSYDQSSSSRLISSYPSMESNSDTAIGGPGISEFSHEGPTYISSQNAVPNGHIHLENDSLPTSNGFSITPYPPPVTRNDSTGLALGPPQRANLEFQPLVSSTTQPSNFNSYDDWSHHRDNRTGDDFFPEEDIRMRSHELLENDEMQQLLRMFTVNGTSNVMPDDGYSFPSYMPSPLPNFNFEVDRGPSGKAVVGWLKLKAAMRWGIFVRKKAAERRKAQLIELDD